MIDAKNNFSKDGAKNRLREQDIRCIVDAWDAHKDIPNYARFVNTNEIVKNNYNLNIPRYVASPDTEIQQDIEAHLLGGIPIHDIDKFQRFWTSCPTLRGELFEEGVPRVKYAKLKVKKDDIKTSIRSNKDFITQSKLFYSHYEAWEKEVTPTLESLSVDLRPKPIINQFGDSLLIHFIKDTLLVDGYDVYETLMNYWNETMQDDFYLISADGWSVELYVPQAADKKTKNGEIKKAKRRDAKTVADFVCDLLPVDIVVNRFFYNERDILQATHEKLSDFESKKSEMKEEYSNEYLDITNFENDKITDTTLKKRVKELKKYKGAKAELAVIVSYIKIREDISDAKSLVKALNADLLKKVTEKYPQLTEVEIKDMVINDKWLGTLSNKIDQQMKHVIQSLTSEIISLVDRYETTLVELDNSITKLEKKVNTHLKAMGFNW